MLVVSYKKKKNKTIETFNRKKSGIKRGGGRYKQEFKIESCGVKEMPDTKINLEKTSCEIEPLKEKNIMKKEREHKNG